MSPASRPFRRLLIANRGEIAVRIIRACRELEIESVAVYSDADRNAGHVRAADLAVRIGLAPAGESYLVAERILEAALATGCEAIHPGYGFLSERAAFAAAIESAGLVFVGPSSGTIAAVGDKVQARRLARSVGVPLVPGTAEPVVIGSAQDAERLTATASDIGYPLLVKAAAGGGGRGMRRVEQPSELAAALEASSAEAEAAFGDGAVYLEHEVRPARHIEVQLLGDLAGSVVAVGERDCSIQRRHQKLVEEAPAFGLTADERATLHELAVRIGSAAGLTNLATAEFLLDRDGRFWFLEVNARLQVEHGVTELVTGLDLVHEQLWLASGAPLSERVRAAASRATAPDSHAIEVRISLEDPARSFAPSGGRVGRFAMPGGPGVRVDTALEPGEQVPSDYDSLVAKLIVHGADRPAAIDRLRRALDETEISGVQTTLPFHRFVAHSSAVPGGRPVDELRRRGLGRAGGAGSGSRPGAPRRRPCGGSTRRARSGRLAQSVPTADSRTVGDPDRTGRQGLAGRGPDRRDRPVESLTRSRPVRASVAAAARLEGDPVRRVDPEASAEVTWLDAEHAILSDEQAVGAGPGATGSRLWIGPARLGRDGISVREVVVDGWSVEVEVEDLARAELRRRATRGTEDGPRRRGDPGPGGAARADRQRRGGRRRPGRGWSGAPRDRGDEDAQRRPRSAGRGRPDLAVSEGGTVERGSLLVTLG